MAQPKLLILDEPSLGLSPLMVQDLWCAARLGAEGLTILLAEQNVKLSLAVSSRGYVMENGRIVLTGGSGELAAIQLREAISGGCEDLMSGEVLQATVQGLQMGAIYALIALSMT